MTLNDNQRNAIRIKLSQPKHQAITNGLDVNDMSDHQLVAFDRMANAATAHQACFNENTGQLEIPLPDGGKMVFNDSANQWQHQPGSGATRGHQLVGAGTVAYDGNVPVALPVRPQKQLQGMALNEFLASGGGTDEDRQTWAVIQQGRLQEKADLIGMLVANAEGQAQEEAIKAYNRFSNEELKNLVAAHRANQQQVQAQAPTPVVNYYGAQGGGYGYASAINEPTLDAPSFVSK
jgi:hypothetical protein